MPSRLRLCGDISSVSNRRWTLRAAGFLLLCFALAPVYGQTVTASVLTGANPTGIAINPVTNKVYVTNLSDSSVTVIDGATNTTVTVLVGSLPRAVALNPANNRIYVANAVAAAALIYFLVRKPVAELAHEAENKELNHQESPKVKQ